jgi:hypothetical protein
VWLGVTIFVMTNHEFSRDEVRALSFARAAVSPLNLLDLVKNEGHPVLWYLLLYIGRSVRDSPLVLPVASIFIAFTAVAIFTFFSPFPLWFKALFIFSALPFYEYSVMARNYGISMLLFFVWAALYRNRMKYSLLLAFVLALLANSNAHSTILVCLIVAVWTRDTIVEKQNVPFKVLARSLCLPLVIVGGGLVLGAAVAIPTKNTILTNAYYIGMGDLARSFYAALVHPARSFSALVPAASGLPLTTRDLLVYATIFGLIPWPGLFLAALMGQTVLGIFFRIVYPGSLRHQGLFLVFLLSLYWIAIESRPTGLNTRMKRTMLRIGLYCALVFILVISLFRADSLILADLRAQKSSNKAFGEFLNGSHVYRNAIILPEPDYVLESLPYYAKNPIYILRERRFGTTVSFTTDADYRLSLGELLVAARDINKNSGQPVLIVLGHRNLLTRNAGETRYSYNKIFSWNADEIAELKRSAEFVAEFNAALTDENYRVYAIQ